MTALAPSEVVFLNGGQFASQPKPWESGTTPPGADGSVSTKQLTRKMVAAAVLANEREGALGLVEGHKKGLFGLRKVATLSIERGDAVPDWPTGSMEARVLTLADELAGEDPSVELRDVAYNLLTEDSPDPWPAVLDTTGRALVDRGVLELLEERSYKVFVSEHYELADGTAERLADADVAAVHQLLSGTEHGRSSVWKLLEREIDHGINLRYEVTHDDQDSLLDSRSYWD